MLAKTAAYLQIEVQNVSPEYYAAIPNGSRGPSERSMMANVTVQVSRFLASGKKSERLSGEDFGSVELFCHW